MKIYSNSYSIQEQQFPRDGKKKKRKRKKIARRKIVKKFSELITLICKQSTAHSHGQLAMKHSPANK